MDFYTIKLAETWYQYLSNKMNSIFLSYIVSKILTIEKKQICCDIDLIFRLEKYHSKINEK